MLPSSVICLYNVCNDRATFDDRSPLCCDEHGRLAQLGYFEELGRGAVPFVAFVEDEIVFDFELLEKPEYALRLRVLPLLEPGWKKGT